MCVCVCISGCPLQHQCECKQLGKNISIACIAVQVENQTLDLGQMHRSKPLAAVEMTFAVLSLHARKQNKNEQVSIDAFILSIDTIESD